MLADEPRCARGDVADAARHLGAVGGLELERDRRCRRPRAHRSRRGARRRRVWRGESCWRAGHDGKVAGIPHGVHGVQRPRVLRGIVERGAIPRLASLARDDSVRARVTNHFRDGRVDPEGCGTPPRMRTPIDRSTCGSCARVRLHVPVQVSAATLRSRRVRPRARRPGLADRAGDPRRGRAGRRWRTASCAGSAAPTGSCSA